MKAKLAILVLLSAAPWVYAGSTVPKLMSYQGRVTDSAGVAIGNTQAVTRTVTFSLYASPSGSDLSYRETQSVTISGGEFSVLIGNGTGVTNYPGPTSPAKSITTLDSVINSAATSALYLGITVDDGNSATQDAEISPRQQLVTGAYAVRALMAESVASGAVTSTMLGNNSVDTNQVATSAINSAKILDGTIAAVDIGLKAVTATKIDTTSVGIWTPSGDNIYRNSNVGIGVTNPAAVLELAAKTGTSTPLDNGLRVVNSTNAAGNNAVLAASVAGSTAGNPFLSLDISGVAGWSVGIDNADSDKLKFSNSWDFSTFYSRLTIDASGNVGIGTTSPTERLTVSGGALKVIHTSNPNVCVSNNTNQATLGVTTSAGQWSTSSSTNDVVLKSDSTKLILQSGAGAAGLVIDSSNNVGIGTSAPVGRLSISESSNASVGSVVLDHETAGGRSSIVFRSKNNRDGGDYGYIQYQDDTNVGGTGESAKLIIGTSNDTDDNIILAPSGRVGIGTTSPLAPLHVAGSVTNAFYLEAYMDANGASDAKSVYHADLAHSIIAEYGVRAARFDVVSDERIKEVIGVSDSARDLAVLQSIEITDYSFKDKLAMGSQIQKRVIAQQVESVYPNAVKFDRGVVPDIFKKAAIDDGWVNLATDLKVGEKVRLISRQEATVQEVLEIRAGGFRTGFTSAEPEVFVYGREVDDFRSVDYDDIAMLNVSATQELAKKLEEKDAVIVALEARLSALEKRVSAAK